MQLKGKTASWNSKEAKQNFVFPFLFCLYRNFEELAKRSGNVAKMQ